MTDRPDGPYVWVTWLTGLLSGDAHCEWAVWFRAHHKYKKRPSDFDAAAWRAQHAEMLRRRVAELQQAGYATHIENQNRFALPGRAATVGGAPDLVAVRDGQALVIDCKTGQQRDSDYFQVLLYMLILPHTHRACKGVALAGEIQYRDGRVPIPPEKLTDEMRALIRTVVERVGGNAELLKVPSYGECRFCDIGSWDCPERIEEAPAAAAPDHELF